MVDFLSLFSLRFWEFKSRGGSSLSRDYRLRYTVVPSTECSRLCFWWFALLLAELSGGLWRWSSDGVVALCLEPFHSPAVEIGCLGCWSWVPSGVIEVCVGFVVFVDLSMDEISILFRLISLAYDWRNCSQ